MEGKPMKKLLTLPILILGFTVTTPLLGQESPEAVYQKWVEASRAGDIQGLLALSSAEKVKEFHEEYPSPQQQEEIRSLMKAMAPITYQVNKSVPSKDGGKTSLFLDATALDFFSLSDPKAKPQRETIEVRLVKENNQWKVDKQCMGKEGCGKEPEWAPLKYGSNRNLGPGATVQVVKGKPTPFKGAPVKNEAFAVDLIFTLPETGPSLSYFLHRSPNFAEFFVEMDGQKITPLARIESFPTSSSEEKPELQVLEDNYSYSRSTNFTGLGTLSLLFDLPKGNREKTLYITVTYGENKHNFSVK